MVTFWQNRALCAKLMKFGTDIVLKVPIIFWYGTTCTIKWFHINSPGDNTGSKFKVVKNRFPICQITRLYSRIVMYYFFNCTFWFSSYRPLKVKGKHCICTGSKKLSTSNFLENGVKLFNYPSPLRKRIVCTLSDAQVSKYNIIRYELGISHDAMATLTFWFITQDRDIWGSANYSFSDSLRSDEHFDTILNEIEATLYFDPCTNLELILTFKAM